jgi:hypothetical protein
MRELLARGLKECRALVDTMVAAAAKANPPLSAAAKALLSDQAHRRIKLSQALAPGGTPGFTADGFR